MTTNFTKIFSDGDDYLSLPELAKSTGYGLEYLLSAAAAGKLKAFKIGDDWLTTTTWFADYQKMIRHEISSVLTAADSRNDNWLVELPSRPKIRLRWRPLILILSIFTAFSLALSWLVFYPAGRQAALVIGPQLEGRQALGDYFLAATDRVYYSAYAAVADMAADSAATAKFSVSLTQETADRTAALALRLDRQTRQWQWSDEIITIKAQALVDAARLNYQRVAGAAEIRRQIYFADWQRVKQLTD